MLERRFLNPYAKVRFTHNRLPHRQQDGITYFVTFRLVDSVPRNLLDRWRSERVAWLKSHPEPWTKKDQLEYDKQFTARVEDWLDNGFGECPFKSRSVRASLETVLQKKDGTEYLQHAWVIMPNHVHVLFSSAEGQSLESTVKGWKGTSGRAINKQLDTTGRFWMKDYFDRMIRDERHFWRCARYIRRNPMKANLPSNAFALYESDHVRDVLDEKAGG